MKKAFHYVLNKPLGEVLVLIALLLSVLLLLITATQAEYFKSIVLQFDMAAQVKTMILPFC